jgi:hypothetical protein
MSTNYAPSRRATTHAGGRPMEVDAAEARFVEAKAITDALVVRLSRGRSELRGASEGERVRVERRVQVRSWSWWMRGRMRSGCSSSGSMSVRWWLGGLWWGLGAIRVPRASFRASRVLLGLLSAFQSFQ